MVPVPWPSIGAGPLALNLVLVRLGYPPVIIGKHDRSKYLDALNRADPGDPARLAEPCRLQ